MGTIRVHTANERIAIDNKPIITSGNKNINDMSVTFCDKWLSLGENTEYWAVFFKDEKVIYKRKLKNGYCLIPNEVMKRKGFFYFGFYATAENGEKVKTSKIAEYEVIQGIPTEETAADEDTDGGNTGGSSSGNISGNIDLSEYVKREELPEIDVDEVVSKIEGGYKLKENVQLPDSVTIPNIPTTPDIDFSDIFEPFTDEEYPEFIETDPTYWKDNKRIDGLGEFDNALSHTCVTPEIYVVNDSYYKVKGNCFEEFAYQYDFDGKFIEATNIDVNGLFKTYDNTCVIRFVVPKYDDIGNVLDLNATVERFADRFKLYYCDKYKLKDNVLLPDTVVIPTKTSELANDTLFVTEASVGALDSLATENKENLVEAINEVSNKDFITEEYYKDHREFYDDMVLGEVFTLQTNMQFDENWTTVVKHDSYDFFSNLDQHYKLVDVEKYPFDWVDPDYYVVDRLDLIYPNGVWANFVTDEETLILVRPVNNRDGSFGFELRVVKLIDYGNSPFYFTLTNTIRDANGNTVYDWKCITVYLENLPTPDITGLTETDLNYVFYGNTRQLKKLDNKFIDIPTIAEKAVEIIDTALLELLG